MRSPLPLPPRSGSLRLPVASDKLGALDFLALSGCEVQITIGKRNSSLGRMARDSQRLLLELEYLRLAPDCVQTMRTAGRDALATQLQRSWQEKQQQLAARIFNATLGSAEYRSFWRTPHAGGKYPAVNESYSADALRGINHRVRNWLQGDYRADNWQFEIHLSEVAGGPGGVLLEALARQADWLRQADAMLQTRLERGPLCGPSTRHRAADVLPNVVRRYFVEGIQPKAALLERRRYELLAPLQELEGILDAVLPTQYRQWMEQRNALLAEAATAPRTHVASVQRILAPCSAPGQPVISASNTGLPEADG
ncbi:MAG: hypothetical protein Hals2KO_13080 [Halioglobus sp.]